jgi:hypothetical protein
LTPLDTPTKVGVDRLCIDEGGIPMSFETSERAGGAIAGEPLSSDDLSSPPHPSSSGEQVRGSGEGAPSPDGSIPRQAWTFLTDEGFETFTEGEDVNLVVPTAAGVVVYPFSWTARVIPWSRITALHKEVVSEPIPPSHPRIAEFTDAIGRGIR